MKESDTLILRCQVNKSEGFVKIFRSILKWRWIKYPETFLVWMVLLLLANFRDGELGGIVIRKGQVVTTLSAICDITGLSIQKVRTSLNRLKLTGEITQTSTRAFTLINIEKYGVYQDDINTPFDNAVTNEQQTNNKQATISKKEKKDNKNNNIIKEKINKREKTQIERDFERFWELYPRKKDKQYALKAFLKINPDEELLTVMLNAVKAQCQSEQWQKDNGRYIPYPTTWLNKRRWEDEADELPAEKKVSFDVQEAEIQALEIQNNLHYLKKKRRKK